MAIPNGVRPQKAETAASITDIAMEDDSASVADSAGWETASDNDTDSASPQAPQAAPGSRGKNAGAARSKQDTSASSSGQQTMDTISIDRADGATARGTATDETSSTQDFEEWDVCRSLFDNHVSGSLEANLEYMFKHFGFYLPDAEYLSDPAGLIKYLVRFQLALVVCSHVVWLCLPLCAAIALTAITCTPVGSVITNSAPVLLLSQLCLYPCCLVCY